jgi:hypothetical protein
VFYLRFKAHKAYAKCLRRTLRVLRGTPKV